MSMTTTTTTTSQSYNVMRTGVEVREASRYNSITLTSGLAPSYLQANLIVLPSRYADDFRLLCARNPVPCPLLAESAGTGSYDKLKSHMEGITGEQIAAPLDIRHAAPRYMVYQDGKLAKKETKDVAVEWTEDHVAFFIGCSFSFENALSRAGLEPRHTKMGRNVPMYRTNMSLCPAGVFVGGTYVVSMRPYRLEDVKKARDITRAFVSTHGEPVAWGWQAVKDLGIKDIDSPEWGDKPLRVDGRPFSEESEEIVPVFWGCGVTPQEAVMRAALEGTIMSHAPGHMIVLDVREDEVFDLADVSSKI